MQTPPLIFQLDTYIPDFHIRNMFPATPVITIFRDIDLILYIGGSALRPVQWRYLLLFIQDVLRKWQELILYIQLLCTSSDRFIRATIYYPKHVPLVLREITLKSCTFQTTSMFYFPLPLAFKTVIRWNCVISMRSYLSFSLWQKYSKIRRWVISRAKVFLKAHTFTPVLKVTSWRPY